MRKSLFMLICLTLALTAMLVTGCESAPTVEIVYPEGDAPPAEEPAAPEEPPPEEPPPEEPPPEEPPPEEPPPEEPPPEEPPPEEPPPEEPPPEESPEQTPIGMSPDPANTRSFYSSFAHMTNYDPAKGWAEFDYFNMLRGEEAVAWLVDREGYSQADAQALVDGFADSEYVYKNTNPGLRTIDLKIVPQITLQFQPDGTQVPEGVPAIVDDVFALYNLDPAYLYDYAFFYIHVNAAEEVTHVEQIYWP